MDANNYVQIIRLFMLGVFEISLPILVVMLFVALAFGIIQSVTQIQEQSLTFFPKMLTLVFILLICGNWMYRRSLSVYNEYFQEILKLF